VIGRECTPVPVALFYVWGVSMIYRFQDLPDDADLLAIAFGVRDVILALLKSKEGSKSVNSYEELEEDVSRSTGSRANATAIRVFLRRVEDKRAPTRNNATLAALFDYILLNKPEFTPDIKTKISALERVATSSGMRPTFVDSLANQFRDWLGTSPRDVSELLEKLIGTEDVVDKKVEYAVLRWSAKEDWMIKSSLWISGGSGDLNTVTAVHRHTDRGGVVRESIGGFIPVEGNIYGILKVEEGAGLDIFTLRNPVQKQFQRMVGFLCSIDVDRNLYCANIVIEKSNENWRKVGARFCLNDLEEPQKSFVQKRIEFLNSNSTFQLPR
jgi:hypothetical protein